MHIFCTLYITRREVLPAIPVQYDFCQENGLVLVACENGQGQTGFSLLALTNSPFISM